jgi:CubicO group peptidase (beta-lactamase class C family)
MAPDTIFRIYSMTKPVTAVALLMLFERGLFRLQDPVSTYLPEFKGVKVLTGEGELVDPLREITIHDLLTHTAGASYGGYAESGALVDKMYDQVDLIDPTIDSREMVRRIATLPLAFHPGEAWRYSVATDVVGYLVEVISGRPLGDYFEEQILGPLGMVDTAFCVPPDKVGRLATPSTGTLIAPHWIGLTIRSAVTLATTACRPAGRGWYPQRPISSALARCS